jgi:hypothetical protein
MDEVVAIDASHIFYFLHMREAYHRTYPPYSYRQDNDRNNRALNGALKEFDVKETIKQ